MARPRRRSTGIADGLTKVSARQRLAEILRRGYPALAYNPSFTSGKQLTDEQRAARELTLDEAAAADALRKRVRSSKRSATFANDASRATSPQLKRVTSDASKPS